MELLCVKWLTKRLSIMSWVIRAHNHHKNGERSVKSEIMSVVGRTREILYLMMHSYIIYGVGHIVKHHSVRGNSPLPLHGLLYD